MKSLMMISLLFLVGCAAVPDAPSGTDEEQAAYEQCLQDNMAVAIAWEIIEQRCAASVSPAPDPLDPQGAH